MTDFQAEQDQTSQQQPAEENQAGEGGETKQETKEHLNIKVRQQDGTEVHFRVKPSTPFKKMFTAWSNKTGKDHDSVLFLFDGTRLRPEQTPAEVDMEDEDQIDVMVHQEGGFQ